LNPTTPISLSVTEGRLTSVKLVNPDGKRVSGSMANDGSSWQSTEVLGYAKTYTLTAVAVNRDGQSVKWTRKYSTVSPSNLTMPYINTTAGGSMDNGGRYGIGIVPVVHFDEPITNKAAAERALQVTTSPHVSGVWSWTSDQDVHWRPRNFFKPGTHVTVRAKVYGVQVGPGLYGQSDAAVSFKIGQKRVAIADDATHQVKVYFSNKLVRTMPTSMGQGGYVSGKGGQQISLWTMSGYYTVIGHENPAIMSSESFGLPANSPLGYAPEAVYWATKISTDGIYLHSAPWSVGQQGYSDVSHGCLNLSPDNAIWYSNHSQVGDVVHVIHTTGPKIVVWQNGDWSVPWKDWVKGSALH
jgi:lipoprotein-anchoring transpeptidase ErfK/SrfK